jgi:hypothetical protein
MGRYILRYSASSPAPSEHVDSIRATPGLKIVDQSPNMLLVDADEPALRKKLQSIPGWSLHSEQGISLPDTRQKIR